jgi:hypothetical protein
VEFSATAMELAGVIWELGFWPTNDLLQQACGELMYGLGLDAEELQRLLKKKLPDLH